MYYHRSWSFWYVFSSLSLCAFTCWRKVKAFIDNACLVLFNLYGPRAVCDDTERIEFKLKFFKILQVTKVTFCSFELPFYVVPFFCAFMPLVHYKKCLISMQKL